MVVARVDDAAVAGAGAPAPGRRRARFFLMGKGALEAEGFAHYVAELRRSSTDPYFAYRVYEKSWNVPPKDAALLRRATVRLIEADPWFLATAMPHFLHSLQTEDLERLTKF